tara:strand:+ start:284 stop:709 length:426 start_codon:yes stop_codon:yes gene_type:complete
LSEQLLSGCRARRLISGCCGWRRLLGLALLNTTTATAYALGERNSWRKLAVDEVNARVPLIVAVPWLGAAARGVASSAIFELTDLYPTLVARKHTRLSPRDTGQPSLGLRGRRLARAFGPEPAAPDARLGQRPQASRLRID